MLLLDLEMSVLTSLVGFIFVNFKFNFTKKLGIGSITHLADFLVGEDEVVRSMDDRSGEHWSLYDPKSIIFI